MKGWPGRPQSLSMGPEVELLLLRQARVPYYLPAPGAVDNRKSLVLLE